MRKLLQIATLTTMLAAPAAFARRSARPSVGLLVGIASALMICAVVEGYL